ncbi:hypothetical protein HELRODRAFT_188468 [Helobdella robusta]|uniref:Alpha-tubulin N-acetyltransferase n=1 Tax=Helobdella robusta TaxID=6412 RepID=T1FQ09_HELRO|nr:hypothetical protein HELRODRAFT_188468 [Helobdella robusta]ESO06716.1 hypothetical protein HELRODRAFT_188468 [Helobdella robusta]
MEFPFKVNELFRDDISIIDCHLIPRGVQVVSSKQSKYKDYVGIIIDELGKASAEAQRLTCEITSKEKLLNTDNRIYLKVDRGKNRVIGYIKVGTKKLFLFDTAHNQHELEPICVLDFYVHESMQRKGCGKELFDFMIQASVRDLSENIRPCDLAINRPSEKFLAFLGKHYSLSRIIPQMNKFVIFDNFFDGREIPVNRRQWNYDDNLDDDEDNDIHSYHHHHLKHQQKLHHHKSAPVSSYGQHRQQLQQQQSPQQSPQQQQNHHYQERSPQVPPSSLTSTGRVEHTFTNKSSPANSSSSCSNNNNSSTIELQTTAYNHKHTDSSFNIFGVQRAMSNLVINTTTATPERNIHDHDRNFGSNCISRSSFNVNAGSGNNNTRVNSSSRRSNTIFY